MFKQIFKTRYAILFSFILVFISSSLLVRITLLILSHSKNTFTASGIVNIFVLGLTYDLGVALLSAIIFDTKMSFKNRLKISGLMLVASISYPFLLSNSYAESSDNRYQNELWKGVSILSFLLSRIMSSTIMISIP